uniref:DUF834 domain-containing protein n=1 Tax=Oryza rufipogon TaxID=4529 RepID=A0A0E0R8T6_ORYRU
MALAAVAPSWKTVVRGSGTEDAIEGMTSSRKGEHGGGPYMLGRLESCPGRAYLKREGKAATSSRAARLGAGLRGEVGKVGDDHVGDDHVPRMCGRGGKARGRRRHGEQCVRSGHGGCRSGEEEGLDRWAPPVSSRRERMEAKWRKKR